MIDMIIMKKKIKKKDIYKNIILSLTNLRK